MKFNRTGSSEMNQHSPSNKFCFAQGAVQKKEMKRWPLIGTHTTTGNNSFESELDTLYYLGGDGNS